MLIESGTIYNGDGNSPRKANIGIKDDKIVFIGNEKPEADVSVCAENLFVAPGFIDIHNHTDVEIGKIIASGKSYEQLDRRERSCHNYIAQGVTTIFTGNCGGGFTSADNLSGFLGDHGFGTNLGHFIPYGSLREELLAQLSADRAKLP
ncbi:MAG TPA: hypothetical protein VMW83_08560 [Spirochaetia bacterium]|nr:hypothetical protein [Spirochaetia bacterium]